jgi:nucleotide-binding universal stress UspA family protein
MAPIQIGAIEQAQIDEVWTVAAPHVERLRSEGVEVHEHSIRGYPPDVLIDFADEYVCDLAVVGSRGRSELAAFFLGSTAHRVLHFAHCDVLVVKET